MGVVAAVAWTVTRRKTPLELLLASRLKKAKCRTQSRGIVVVVVVVIAVVVVVVVVVVIVGVGVPKAVARKLGIKQQ